MPSAATLVGLSVPQRIVAIAESQVGYSTEPSDSYCNKFSSFWDAGTADCPSGETSEEWCADFAAWAWREAGVQFTYGYGPEEINGGAVSFYEWGVANGEWHPVTSNYVAAPGDVAIYGLSLGADPSAQHVAIVTDDEPGQSGPDAVNGDGDLTGFSRVETGTDQAQVEVGQADFHACRLCEPTLEVREGAESRSAPREPRGPSWVKRQCPSAANPKASRTGSLFSPFAIDRSCRWWRVPTAEAVFAPAAISQRSVGTDWWATKARQHGAVSALIGELGSGL